MESIFQIKARLLYNRKVNPVRNFFSNGVKQDHLHCALEAVKIANCAKPGQFVNIKVADNVSPLLRRPLSIHRVRGSKIEILYAVAGQATEILSQKNPGEYLDIIGPLGNGFNYPLSAKRYPLSILVAGGMGVAPLVFLAERLKGLWALGSGLGGQVLIGAKSKGRIICEDEFRKLGYEVKIATEDGSRGFKGQVIDLLKKFLPPASSLQPPAIIYACGPRPMLKAIASISNQYKIPAQVSLEEHMSCGIGACLGCVVNTRQGYKRVCKEGPVFEADEVVW